MASLKKGDLFVIIKDVRYSRHKLLESLPMYHQYEYMHICDMKRFGKRKYFQIKFFEGLKDLDEGLWFESELQLRDYEKRRKHVPAEYYKWTNEKILVNLMKCSIIESTTYREIAKRFLDEERM